MRKLCNLVVLDNYSVEKLRNLVVQDNYCVGKLRNLVVLDKYFAGKLRNLISWTTTLRKCRAMRLVVCIRLLDEKSV